MLFVETETSAPLASQDSIQAFENGYHIKIPQELKEVYLNFNPLTLQKQYYYDKGIKYCVHHFHPLSKEFHINLESAYSQLEWYYDGKYLPFASDRGGWDFVVSVNNEDYGKIYFCRLDKPLEEALTLIAENLEKFVSGLRDKIEEA
jgi:hypothetical protein